MGELVLETVKLRKTYETNAGKVYALSGVDLQARRGDFVAIMGPSGSGKTTLLNLIGCLDKPTSGKVILDGVDITDMPEGSLHEIRREKIGFVFQSFNLIQNLSALENVELPMESLGVLKKRRRKRARNLLHLVGLQKRGKHRPAQLSAGEQQRVAIARALANEPTIVLADEPTGNVDQKTSLSIIKLLGELSTGQKATIVMVTHDGRMASLAGRVISLKNGRLEERERKGTYLGANQPKSR